MDAKARGGFGSGRAGRTVQALLAGFALAAIAVPVIVVARSPAVAGLIDAALASPSRPAAERAIDASRKPKETIAFAGVKPGMAIGEFFPGGGYFTRLLSAVVGKSGHVYGIENAGWKSAYKADQQLLADGALGNVSIEALPFGAVQFPRPLDLVWVTQNYHDLKIAEYGQVDTAAFNRAIFSALKPGGVYFILDHEAPAGTELAAIAKLHRIERSQVVREVTAAGFRLAAEGTFLRRPTDDHSLSIFDKRVQGQTDQYALKFVKPAR